MQGVFLCNLEVRNLALTELSRQQIIIKRQERAEKPEPEKTAAKKSKKESIFAPESEAVTDEL